MAARKRRSNDWDTQPTIRMPSDRGAWALRDFGNLDTIYAPRPKPRSAAKDFGATVVTGVKENPITTIVLTGVLFFASGWLVASYPTQR